MSEAKEYRHLLAFTRAVISILMAAGFGIDGCQSSDWFFFVATAMWVYQPYVIRTESYLLHALHHPHSSPARTRHDLPWFLTSPDRSGRP